MKKGLGGDESELEDSIGVYRCFDARDAKFCGREPRTPAQIGPAFESMSQQSVKRFSDTDMLLLVDLERVLFDRATPRDRDAL